MDACVDATGFTLAWYEGRWSLTKPDQREGSKWLKVHAIIDAASKTVLAWRLTGPVVNDTTQFESLVQHLRCRLREIYADAGYLSQKNCNAARAAGATPFIRPKKTTKRVDPPRSIDTRTPFQRMVAAEQHDTANWYARYGRRNGIESTFRAIKHRWGGRLRAINRLMRAVEAQLKLVAWNLTRIRHGEF